LAQVLLVMVGPAWTTAAAVAAMAPLPPERSAARRVRPSPQHEVGAAPTARRRFAFLAIAVGAACAWLASADGGLLGFVSGPSLTLQTGPASQPLDRLHQTVMKGTGGRGTYGIVYMRPKPQGFQPAKTAELKEVQPQPPKIRWQQKNFIKYVNEGYPVSQLFVRFPGKTPWKQIGEIVSSSGDFSEAIQAQWLLLVRRTYTNWKKFRFFMPSETPIQFGYTDENANVIAYDGGPMAEAIAPAELNAMLKRSGYWPAEKRQHWTPMTRKVMARECMEEYGNTRYLNKPYLAVRAQNMKLSEGTRWWKPTKMPIPFHLVQRKKRGKVISVGHSTKWEGWMGK